MCPECRHIQLSGRKCHAPALRGTAFCYFHTRLHTLQKTPLKPTETIDIPALEDRASIQLAITQVLRAFATGCVDRPRAYTLLYGLQLAARNVDHTMWAIPFGAVESLVRNGDGEELAPPEVEKEEDGEDDDEEDEEEEEEEEDDDDEGDGEDDEDDGEVDEEVTDAAKVRTMVNQISTLLSDL